MKKTSVQNLIINALLLVEAVLIVFFLLRMITKPRDKEAGAVVPDRELTIAEQEGIEPVEPVVGNSKPVDVEPVEGIRITAPANALDKDREFKITPVDEKTWEKTEKRIADESGEKMLFCFDLDAGMKPEEHIPGEYTVSLDLEQMGIPPELYDYISIWRQSGDYFQKYCTRIENGKLIYRSDQNSIVVGTVAFILIDYTILTIIGVVSYWSYEKASGAEFFNYDDDRISVTLKHPNGDHTIYAHFKMTEYKDRFDEFKSSKKDHKNRLNELEKQADAEYKRRLDERYGEGGMRWLKEWGNKRSKEAIDRSAIFMKLCKEDEQLKKIEELMKLPPSIVDLGLMIIAANKFLSEHEGLTNPFWNLPIYLMDIADKGHLEYPDIAAPYMIVNYKGMLADNIPYKRQGKGEDMLMTLTHELFHYRQKKSQWITNMDYRTEETTAAYQEKVSSAYFFKKGIMTTKVSIGDHGIIETSPRENYEMFGNDFNANAKKYEGFLQKRKDAAEESYTYADLMDFLEKKKGLKKPLTGKELIDNYTIFSHKKLYMKWFGITEEKEFENCLREFCLENYDKIVDRQNSMTTEKPDLATISFTVSPGRPVVEAETVKGDLILRSFDVQSDIKENAKLFNAFVVRGKGCTPEQVQFYTSTSAKVKKEELYLKTIPGAKRSILSGAYFKPQSSALPFKIVALFAPDAPEIEKVKKDKISFKLPKPENVLVKNRFVTGAVVTYKNARGQEQKIKAKDNQFGKTVKWSMDGANQTDFTLSFHWCYETEDGKVYESPESEEAVYHAIKEEEEREETKETKGQGYWELVDTKTEGQLSYTDEHGCTATISGGDGKYTYHAEYLARFFEKGVIPTMTTELIYVTPYTVKHWRTIDHDFIFETPKQFYLPGEEPGPGMITEAVRVTTVQHDGNVDQFDSQTNFSALCYCSIKGLNENIQPYDGFVFNRPSLKEQKQRHESNTPIPTHDLFLNKTKDGFRMIQEINTPHAEKCYLRIIYTYMWREGKIKKK